MMSTPIEGSERWARMNTHVRNGHEIIDALNGKAPANADTVVEVPFTGHEGRAMREALGAAYLALREWWASWFELTPRAKRIVRRTLALAWVVTAFIAPVGFSVWSGKYLVPALMLWLVWKAYRAMKRAARASKARRGEKRVAGGGKKSRRILIQWG